MWTICVTEIIILSIQYIDHTPCSFSLGQVLGGGVVGDTNNKANSHQQPRKICSASLIFPPEF